MSDASECLSLHPDALEERPAYGTWCYECEGYVADWEWENEPEEIKPGLYSANYSERERQALYSFTPEKQWSDPREEEPGWREQGWHVLSQLFSRIG